MLERSVTGNIPMAQQEERSVCPQASGRQQLHGTTGHSYWQFSSSIRFGHKEARPSEFKLVS